MIIIIVHFEIIIIVHFHVDIYTSHNKYIFALLITSVMSFCQYSVCGWNTLWIIEDILRVVFSFHLSQSFEVAAVVLLGPVLN